MSKAIEENKLKILKKKKTFTRIQFIQEIYVYRQT